MRNFRQRAGKGGPFLIHPTALKNEREVEFHQRIVQEWLEGRALARQTDETLPEITMIVGEDTVILN